MKFCGTIGFITTVQKAKSVYVPEVVERKYYGDVIKNVSRWDESNSANDNLNVNNRISIISDPYAQQNFSSMKYAVWNNARWKITSAEVQFPRIILTIGGVYNGED